MSAATAAAAAAQPTPRDGTPRTGVSDVDEGTEASREEVIANLREENARLKRRVAYLEMELSAQLEGGSSVANLVSLPDTQSICDSASTLSRLSHFDAHRIHSGVQGGGGTSIIGRTRLLEFEQHVQQKRILEQVRHRRFTLRQERTFARDQIELQKEQSRMSELHEEEEKKEEEQEIKVNKDANPDGAPRKRRAKLLRSSSVSKVDTNIADELEESSTTDDATVRARPNSKEGRSRRRSRRSSLAGCVSMTNKVAVFQLPRGGVYVQTSKGPLQFGIPPETIKDPMEMGLEVPKLYVVPKERFNLRIGINMCEVEFPAYFNFFLRQSSVQLVCTPEVAGVVRAVLDETLEGPSPEHLYVENEYLPNGPSTGRFSYAARPDHVKEINFFKEPRDGRRISTDTLLNFLHFVPLAQAPSELSTTALRIAKEADEAAACSAIEEEKDRGPWLTVNHDVLVACLGNGVDIVDCGDEYVVVDDGEEVARVACFLSAWAPAPAAQYNLIPANITDPPQFGITVLGSSHGFDAKGATSGFVLWMHKKGIMVDPPPNATEILQSAGIIPSMITGIILTHCHADHDAGAFQKILKEGRITLITTQTIFSSFIRKYSIISGFAEAFLLRLFEHRIVRIGEDVHWGGGTLRFFYSLHALPCIGFEASVGGRTFVYSSDTFYEPEGLRSLRDRGYLSEQRCQALLDFPWHYDVVLHEAGIPPIHTPVETLQKLPPEVQENLYIIHVAETKARESGLRLAMAGVENTIVIETDPHEHATSAAILQLLRSTDIFRHFTIEQASDLLQLCRRCDYKPGDYVCRAGEIGVHFYVILSGFCTVKLSKGQGGGRDLFEEFRAERDAAQSSEVRDSGDDSSSKSSGGGGGGGGDGDGVGVGGGGGDQESPRSPAPMAEAHSARSERGKDPAQDPELQTKVFGAGDYLGELALLTEKERTADIVALTDLQLIKLDLHAFKYLLDTTPGLQHRMERLSKIRCSLSWKAIGANSVLAGLRSTQRSQLQSVMQVGYIKAGTELWKRDKPVERAYLLASGRLEFLEMREELQMPFTSGAFFCNISSMMTQRQEQEDQQQHSDEGLESPSPPGAGGYNARRRGSRAVRSRVVTSRVTLVAKTDVDLYYIEADDCLEFLDQNPGVFIQLMESLVLE